MRHSENINSRLAETRRATNTTRRKIGSGVPEGLGGALRPHCGAVAGMSVHAPMT